MKNKKEYESICQWREKLTKEDDASVGSENQGHACRSVVGDLGGEVWRLENLPRALMRRHVRDSGGVWRRVRDLLLEICAHVGS